jgi:putative FmdB family regulatory protein
MPIYEYRCRTCGDKFSHLHRRADEKAPDCPECGADAPRKLFSVFSAAVAVKTPSCSLGKCPSGGSCKTGGCPLG